jgi:hypothetical protein
MTERLMVCVSLLPLMTMMLRVTSRAVASRSRSATGDIGQDRRW